MYFLYLDWLLVEIVKAVKSVYQLDLIDNLFDRFRECNCEAILTMLLQLELAEE